MRWYVDFIDRDSMWDTIWWVFVYDFAVMSKWTGSGSDFVTWLYVTGLSAILVAVLLYLLFTGWLFLCDLVTDLKDNVGIIIDLTKTKYKVHSHMFPCYHAMNLSLMPYVKSHVLVVTTSSSSWSGNTIVYIEVFHEFGSSPRFLT